MEKKYQIYPNQKLAPDLIQKAIRLFEESSKSRKPQQIISSIYTTSQHTEEKFLSSYSEDVRSAELFLKYANGATFNIKYHGDHTEVSVTHPEKIDLEQILSPFGG